nr:hypothetical transcript [Hymenolepis microstoma]
MKPLKPSNKHLLIKQAAILFEWPARLTSLDPRGIIWYEELLRRINVPYTPRHHLEHRRKLAMVPHLQQQLAHEILEEATLERKQEKRSPSK